MKEYFKKFETNADYTTYIEGSSKILPNVSLVTEDNDVHYSPLRCEETSIYEIVGTPSYPSEIKGSATSFDITFNYKRTDINIICVETVTEGSDSVTVECGANPSASDARTVSGTVIWNDVEIEYSLTQSKSMNIITYAASSKLAETTTTNESGLHTNAFNTTIKSHTFENGVGTIEFNDDVTSIGDEAFYYCSGITSIVMPSSVTSIGTSAFTYCSGLTSINIQNSVTSVGAFSFGGCHSLTSITVDVNNNVYDSRNNCNAIIETSGNTLVCGCQNTVIPNTVTSIGEGAFAVCSDLTSITIPDSVTNIDEYAFYNCSSLTSITCNADTAPFIANNTFQGVAQNGILTVSIGNSGYDVWMSNNPYYLGYYGWTKDEPRNVILYYASTKLAVTTNQWEKGLHSNAFNTTIKSHTFGNGVGTVVFNDDVTSIGNRAFYYCSGITSIYIPSGVTSIGTEAFNGCYRLSSITIPSSVTSVGTSAFTWCSGLTSINIPDNVTSVGDYAFTYCSGLTSCTIGSSVTSIGTATFSGCTSLANCTIGSSVTTIGDSAFYFCSGLTSIDIPNSVTSIDQHAFQNCRGLTSVNIPSGVTSIGDLAFYYCNGLTSIDIPSGVTSIGSKAFNQCSSLTSITVDSNNAAYDSRNNCNAIIEISTNTLISGCKNTVIPNSVTSIGEGAFAGGSFTDFTSITIPDSVTNIGSGAFQYCSGLTSIVIPSGVTSMGSSVFWYCESLISVTVEATTPPTLGSNAFHYNAMYRKIYVPAASVNTYKGTKNWSTYASDINAIPSE